MTDFIEGYYEMFGRHVALCIADYATYHKRYDKMEAFRKDRLNRKGLTKKQRESLVNIVSKLHDYETARHYLFEGGLDYHIDKMGLNLNAEAVRKRATQAAENISVFNETEKIENELL